MVDSGTNLAPAKIFKTGNVAFSAGSTFTVALNGTTAGTGYDQLSVTGTVNLAGATLDDSAGRYGNFVVHLNRCTLAEVTIRTGNNKTFTLS